MTDNLTDIFINNLYDIINKLNSNNQLISLAKKSLLDYIGVTLAGTSLYKEKNENLLDYLGISEDGSSIIGMDKKSNISNVAFLNGLNSHVAELDDGTRYGGIHPGAPIISALLPIAEKNKIDGINLLIGIIVGYEAAIRLAQSIQPSHSVMGYHPTGTCGTIGAAISISVALEFSKNEMKNAFSSAANIASGTLKVIEDDSELKPINVGNAAKSGLLSAIIAKTGFRSPKDILSGEYGFLNLMSKEYDATYFRIGESEPYAIEKTYFKPYAACRHCHAPIEAVFNIISKSNFKPNDIKKIKVKTYEYVIGKHDHKIVNSKSSAKMSIPHNIATTIINGKADLEEFNSNNIYNKEIKLLTEKVEIISNNELTSMVPDKRPVIIEIITGNGEIHKERIDFPKGEPENPMSAVELKEKFISLAKYGNKTEKEAERIIDCVWDIENKVDDLFELI